MFRMLEGKGSAILSDVSAAFFAAVVAEKKAGERERGLFSFGNRFEGVIPWIFFWGVWV